MGLCYGGMILGLCCGWGDDRALLWGGVGSHQESQDRAAPGQFAYGWHSHHAGHQQPDGLNEAFSAMGDFWQWQLVDQAPQQHWHLHADHASPPDLVQITHADIELCTVFLPYILNIRVIIYYILHIIRILAYASILYILVEKDISDGTCM